MMTSAQRETQVSSHQSKPEYPSIMVSSGADKKTNRMKMSRSIVIIIIIENTNNKLFALIRYSVAWSGEGMGHYYIEHELRKTVNIFIFFIVRIVLFVLYLVCLFTGIIIYAVYGFRHSLEGKKNRAMKDNTDDRKS